MASKRTHFRRMRGRRLRSYVKGQRLITLSQTTLPAMIGSSVFPKVLPVVQDWPHLSFSFSHTTQASKHKYLIPKCLAVFTFVNNQRKHFGSSSKIIQKKFCGFLFSFFKKKKKKWRLQACLMCKNPVQKKKKKCFVLCIYANVCIVFMSKMCICMKCLVCNSIVCLVASYLC